MNSLTTQYRRSQLIALPVSGGAGPAQYRYAVRIPGGRECVSYQFAEWVVGDFNSQAEAFQCKNSTDDTSTPAALKSTLSAGTGKSGKSFSGDQAIRTTVCSLLSGSRRSSEGWIHEH